MEEQEIVCRGNKLAARSVLYEAFHLAFGAEPSEEVAAKVLSEQVAQAFDTFADRAVGEQAEKLADAWGQARTAFKAPDIEAAGQAYQDLFLVPGEAYTRPWESAHTGKTATLFKQSTVDVKRIFAENGFELKAEGNFPPDHLSAMLDFMGRMSLKAYDLFADGKDDEVRPVLNVQAAFLQNHLLNWVNDFAEQVCGKDATGVYAQAANLLVRFLKADEEALDTFLAA